MHSTTYDRTHRYSLRMHELRLHGILVNVVKAASFLLPPSDIEFLQIRTVFGQCEESVGGGKTTTPQIKGNQVSRDKNRQLIDYNKN